MDLLSWSCGLLVLGMALVAQPGVSMAAQNPSEYEVKAAFLYNFAKFVEWPPETANGPFCIAVAGEDPFGAVLDDVLKGKSVNGRGFVIKRFKTGQEPSNCQILFISASEKKKLPPLLDYAAKAAVLTVADVPGFCEQGGAVNLQLADGRVRLEVNLQAAESAHLQLSSKLLSLAKIVRTGGK